MKLFKTLKDQKGMVIFFTMVVVVVFTYFLAEVFTDVSVSSSRNFGYFKRFDAHYYAAESGIERALYELKDDVFRNEVLDGAVKQLFEPPDYQVIFDFDFSISTSSDTIIIKTTVEKLL